MDKNIEAKVKAAAHLGDAWYRSGGISIPHYDFELRKLYVNLTAEELIQILNAWNKAWHKANLANPLQIT